MNWNADNPISMKAWADQLDPAGETGVRLQIQHHTERNHQPLTRD